MNFVSIQPFRGLCNQLGAICWAVAVAKARKLDGVRIDGMVTDAEDPTSVRVPAHTFLDLDASSESLGIRLVATLPPDAKVVVNLGRCKYDRGNLQHYIASLVFSKTIHAEASSFIHKPYSAVHLRIESDMLKHLQKVLRWKGNIYETLIESYRKALESLPKDQPLFVASNFGKTRKTAGRPIPATKGFTKIVQTPSPNLKAKNRDLRAAVDFLICVEAEVFVGAPFSTFSQGVAHVRKARAKPTCWIEAS